MELFAFEQPAPHPLAAGRVRQVVEDKDGLEGLDHGVGHFRPLSITRQRHLLVYHGIAMRSEDLCQVFWQLFVTGTHCISIAYKRIFISMTYKKSNKIK